MRLDSTHNWCYPKLSAGLNRILTRANGAKQHGDRYDMNDLTASAKSEEFTHFAPVERAPFVAVKRQYQLVIDTALLHDLYAAVSEFVLVLNAQRQIVFANRNLLDHLRIPEVDAILGMRPGEALQCMHAFESHGGCGTTKFCRMCGAVKSILLSQKDKQDMRECRIQQRDGGDSLELLVRSSPLRLGTEKFTIFAVIDISHEKRRRAMERIFFHDLINTAMSLKLLSENLNKVDADHWDRYCGMIAASVKQLIEEINCQRDLAAAEGGELSLFPGPINSMVLLQELVDIYAGHELAKDRHIHIDARTQGVCFESDRVILLRVLGNMVKNALEACNTSEVVSIGSEKVRDGIKFWVHNPGCMSEETSLQVFQRSFSTKGVDRGLGCYSMQLLSERYLHGRVRFTSSPHEGTTFIASYPLRLASPG